MLFKSNNFLCCYKVSGSRLKVQVKNVPNYRKNHHGNQDCKIPLPSTTYRLTAYSFFAATTLLGFKFPIRPLSVPALLSITALINVGFPESIASFTASVSSSGDVTLTPTPPNASIILSYLESLTNTVVAASAPPVGLVSNPRYIPLLLNTTTHTGKL